MVGKRSFVSVKARLVPRPVHQIRRILAVVDGELQVEPDARRVFAQQARADGVERAGIFGRGRRRGLGREVGGRAAARPGG